MKVCVIFRGDHVREATHVRKYIDILMCWDNLKKTIYDDLTTNGHECDIVFITYCSKIVEDIKNIIAPTHIEIKERINQSENFKNVLSFMNKYKNTYDRFVILRCDFMYRINITTWPKWDKNGIILVNKDVHWPTYRFYADVMFIVDSTSVDTFTNAYYYSIKISYTIHGLGCFLYNNSIPFHLMYEDYYHMDKYPFHPLHVLGSMEDIPDLANPLSIEPIKDVSYWN
jgi:hypothetical protein